MATLDQPYLLSLQLPNGATDQYPRAFVYKSNQSSFPGSPFNLAHASNGSYVNTFTPTGDPDYYFVNYIVYSDSGHTTESSLYGRTIENIKVDSQEDNIIRGLGLAQENFRLKDQVYTQYGGIYCLDSATLRIYGNASDCTNDVNPIAEYTFVGTYDTSGNCTSYKVVKV